jgi:hypothetical protein
MLKKLFFILAMNLSGVLAFAQSEDYPLANPLAGNTTYDYHHKVNDTVLVIDGGMAIKTVKVHENKNGLYKVARLDITDWEIRNDRSAFKWYKANSVYPYINMEDFATKTKPYKTTIESLLNCLSQNKNMSLTALTGSNNWPTYYIKDDNEYNTMKADLDNCVKVLKTFKNLPNTFLPYDKNPAIWVAVVNDGVSYLDCLRGVGNPIITRTVNRILDEIAVAKTTASNFKGGTEGLYQCSSCYDYMFCAVSDNERKDWINRMTGFNTDVESVKKINAAFDDLKTVCASKISLVKIPDWHWAYSATGLETVMKNHLKNSSSLTIHKTGCGDADWQIEKNEFGIPLYRYKRTYMWIRNPSSDHPYCKSLTFVIKQEYSGGGAYGGSTVKEYYEEICGCP